MNRKPSTRTAVRTLQIEKLESRWTPAWVGVPPAVVAPPSNAVAASFNSVGDAAGRAAISVGEVDYYRFTAPATGVYQLTATTPASRLDPVLGLFNAAGQRLASNDDISWFNTDSRLAVRLAAGTTYYVGITNYAGSPGGAYNWTIDGPTPPRSATAGVDLVGASLTASNNKLGQPITVQAAVRNSGSAASGAFGVEWWLSPDSTWSPDDIILTDLAGVGNRILPGLAAGATSQPINVTLSLPPALPAGWNPSSVHLVMRTDAGNLVPEINENNNTGQVGLGRDHASLSVVDRAAGQFEITLNISGMSASQRAIFRTAADRWAEVIVGDLPNVNYNGMAIDDVRIDARGTAIDGPGGILGRAGPDVVRRGSYLPVLGTMEFDTADLNRLEADGGLLDVILHEMGHVLGFGTIWTARGLLQGAGTANPLFTGPRATAEYNRLYGGNAAGVPLENGGGRGTRDGHFRESAFANELMTGYLNRGVNPLSRVTIAAMADLGYQVNLAAANGFARPATNSSASLSASSTRPALLAEQTDPASAASRRLDAWEAALAQLMS